MANNEKQSALTTQQLLTIGGGLIAVIVVVAILLLNGQNNDDTPADDGNTMSQSENTDTTTNDELGESVDGSIVFESQGTRHLGSGEVFEDEYNSNPPTSGPHAPSWAPVDLYLEVVPDILMIHNLEHGHVWLSYRDEDDQEAIDALTALQAQNPQWVVVTNRPENDARIAVAAWTRLLELDDIDVTALEAFIDNYRDNAPESIPG